MARARNIKPALFANDILAELDPVERLAFIGLWTIVDFRGCAEYRPKKIKALILPYDDCDMDKILINLDKSGFIRTYVVDGEKYLKVTNFEKHQNPHKNERDKGSDIPDYVDSKGLESDSSLIAINPDNNGTNRADSLSLIPDSLKLIPDIRLPCKSDEVFIFEIDSEYHKQLAAAYKSKDIINEFNRMEVWLSANPKKLKTLNGMKSFITRWLSKKDKNDFPNDIPFNDIANAYNENFARPLNLSDVASMTDARKRSIMAIWEFRANDDERPTNNVDYFARYFECCQQVDFLAGRKTDFIASIDYLLKQETYINILENNYRD